jgi:Tfp pilus assembly protein PilX
MQTENRQSMKPGERPGKRPGRRQEGAALIVAVVTLLMVAMIGINALKSSQEESTSGGRARNATHTLHVADAGVQFAVARLAQTPPNLSAFSVNVDGATVQSRARSQGSPQNLVQEAMSSPPEGFAINVGSDSSFAGRVYQVNVTATSGTGSVAEVEARFSRLDSGGSAY